MPEKTITLPTEITTTTATMIPRATRSCQWDASPTTTELLRHLLIDEGVDTHNQSDYISANVNEYAAKMYFYDENNTSPAVVDAVTKMRYRFRYKSSETRTLALAVSLWRTNGDGTASFVVEKTLELDTDEIWKTGYYDFILPGAGWTKAEIDKLEVYKVVEIPSGGGYDPPEIEV